MKAAGISVNRTAITNMCAAAASVPMLKKLIQQQNKRITKLTNKLERKAVTIESHQKRGKNLRMKVQRTVQEVKLLQVSFLY